MSLTEINKIWKALNEEDKEGNKVQMSSKAKDILVEKNFNVNELKKILKKARSLTLKNNKDKATKKTTEEEINTILGKMSSNSPIMNAVEHSLDEKVDFLLKKCNQIKLKDLSDNSNKLIAALDMVLFVKPIKTDFAAIMTQFTDNVLYKFNKDKANKLLIQIDTFRKTFALQTLYKLKQNINDVTNKNINEILFNKGVNTIFKLTDSLPAAFTILYEMPPEMIIELLNINKKKISQSPVNVLKEIRDKVPSSFDATKLTDDYNIKNIHIMFGSNWKEFKKTDANKNLGKKVPLLIGAEIWDDQLDTDQRKKLIELYKIKSIKDGVVTFENSGEDIEIDISDVSTFKQYVFIYKK